MRRLALAVQVALVASAGSVPAASGGWAWLSGNAHQPQAERAEVKRPQAASADDESVCVAHIKRAQERHGIPNDILLGIGLQETGQNDEAGKLAPWPWSANAAGTGRWFDSKSAGLEWVRHQLDAVTDSVDVGCMQINLRWHPEAFDSLEEAFDPASNVEYAADLLVRLKNQVGSWELAAGSYHSFTPEHRQRYLRALRKKFRYIERDPGYYDQLASTLPVERKVAQAEVAPRRQPQVQRASGPIWSAALSTGDAGSASGSLYSSGKIAPLFSN